MERIFSQVREKTKAAQKHQKDHYDSRVFGGRYKKVWLYSPATCMRVSLRSSLIPGRDHIQF